MRSACVRDLTGHRCMGAMLLCEIPFEVLADKQVGRFDAQFADQQIDTDDRQLLWIAGAVAGLPLWPRRIDPGVYGYVCHGVLAVPAVRGDALRLGPWGAG